MKRQILCAGTGGQGTILLARVLCEGAMREKRPVISAETHGMAMRGGSVVCQVKIGGFASPLILPGRADVLLALDAGEAARHRYYLGARGVSVVNTPAPSAPGEVDALSLARGAGSAQALNMALLGFAAKLGVLGVGAETLEVAVEHLSPERHRAVNLRAFRGGRTASPTS
jgi:indolepyruvate ferredoxin oxidoreductase beta subunit